MALLVNFLLTTYNGSYFITINRNFETYLCTVIKIPSRFFDKGVNEVITRLLFVKGVVHGFYLLV